MRSFSFFNQLIINRAVLIISRQTLLRCFFNKQTNKQTIIKRFLIIAADVIGNKYKEEEEEDKKKTRRRRRRRRRRADGNVKVK
jgi:hypothetical protein